MQQSNQKGAALIIFAVIVSLIILGFTFKNLNGNQLEATRKDKTAKALFEAKNALLGWSVLRGITGQPGMPGQLPCPEDTTLIGTVNEGSELANCDSALPVVGRLPWKTLGLGDLRDGNGEKLWYVLSPGFRNAPINSTTIGQINVNGTPNAAVAIILSVGVILNGQNRPAPTAVSPPLVADYLDLTNNNGDINFSSTGPIATFNDNLLLVSQSELFQLIERRILREIRGDATQGLARFYIENSNNYSFADTDMPVDGTINPGALIGAPSYKGDTDPDSIFFNAAMKNILEFNGWMSLINYQVSPDRQFVTMTLNGQTLTLP